MAEDTQIQEDLAPVTETQDAPIPSAEQQTASEVATSDDQPASVKEHNAREFEKMRSQLREERARREYMETMFQQMQSKAPAQPETPSIIDPDTGLPREDVLTDVQRRAIEAEQRAIKAEQSMQQYLQEQEDRQVFDAHPEVDPNNKAFSQDLHNLTSALMLKSMIDPNAFGGKELSFMEATQRAKSFLGKGMETARKEGAQEALEQLTSKEQASLDAEGNPAARADYAGNAEELAYKTRKGDLDAIVARLKRIQE